MEAAKYYQYNSMYIYLVKGFNFSFQEKYQGQKDENQKIKKTNFYTFKGNFFCRCSFRNVHVNV